MVTVQIARYIVARAQSEGEQDGFILIMFALVLTALMTMAALAIDVGSFYHRADQIQRAADAASLAAVTYMPDDLATATSVAQTAAAKNGFTDGANGVTITVSAVSGNSRQILVKIRDTNVRTFFGRMLTNSIAIGRSATAEYVLAVPLGSPLNTFGNQSVGDTPNFWASIQAPYTDKANGDPYATKCLVSSSATSCSTTNSEYRNSGYLYAIEVPPSGVGQTLTVQVFDASFKNIGLNVDTGDYAWNGSGPAMQYELFEADNTPLDNSDNPTMETRCSTGPGRLVIAPGAATYYKAWTTVCAATVTKSGNYLLRVKSSNIAGYPDTSNATNQYSLKATLSGATQPKIYGIGDMSIFTGNAGTTIFYLAEVAAYHAGKTFEISLFDPGDASTSGNFYMNILKPDGTTATCTYTNASGVYGSSGPCRIQTRSGSTNIYNGKWLTIHVNLATTYTCAATCWWKVNYEFPAGSQPTDRTVWSASILGDPVHLVQ
jgi:hypothetical protein